MERNRRQDLRLEDFMLYQRIAYQRGNINAMNQLTLLYPDLAEKQNDAALMGDVRTDDWGETWIHPSTSGSSRMTSRHVLDMVAYLLGRENAPRTYRQRLKEAGLLHRTIFNYALDRYQQDYDREALWRDYFLAQPELRQILEHRRIGSLGELEYRTSEYFHLFCWCRGT